MVQEVAPTVLVLCMIMQLASAARLDVASLRETTDKALEHEGEVNTTKVFKNIKEVNKAQYWTAAGARKVGPRGAGGLGIFPSGFFKPNAGEPITDAQRKILDPTKNPLVPQNLGFGGDAEDAVGLGYLEWRSNQANSCDKFLVVEIISKDKDGYKVPSGEKFVYGPGEWSQFTRVFEIFARTSDAWFTGKIQLNTSERSALGHVSYFGSCETSEVVTNIDYPAREMFEIDLGNEAGRAKQIIFSADRKAVKKDEKWMKAFGVIFSIKDHYNVIPPVRRAGILH